MIINETHECNAITVKADRNADLRQFGEWVQLDKQQAAQLIEFLQRWINGEGIE